MKYSNLIQKSVTNVRTIIFCLVGVLAFVEITAQTKHQKHQRTSKDTIPQYTIVVDPGHGGAPDKRRVDKWDPVTGKYLGRYLYGGVYKNHHEHKIVLPLAKRLHYYLSLTRTNAGWAKFLKLLKKFSYKKKHKRIIFQPHLTRTTSYSDFQYAKTDPRNHTPYLLYDYPDKKNHRMQKGRLSLVNHFKPYLVISLHTTPAGGRQTGGMAAVLSPGYKTFNMIKDISLDKMSINRFRKSAWYSGWLVTNSGWTRYEAARSDAWVYFHGYKTLKGRKLRIWKAKNRGLRHNMLQWRYADPPGWHKLARFNQPGPYSTNYYKFQATGKFWDRERSLPEQWRRENGRAGFGGDNHYASDELLRYVQHGTRLLSPALRKKSAIGPVLPPFVSTFSLPTYTNAIVAYLEIGHHNRQNDRRLLITYREDVAKSLAVGIYSLFEGLSLGKRYSPWHPRAEKLDFSRYEKYKGQNYFKMAVK